MESIQTTITSLFSIVGMIIGFGIAVLGFLQHELNDQLQLIGIGLSLVGICYTVFIETNRK